MELMGKYKYNSRKSQRLENYDYSKKGIYFLTICAYRHQHIFGSVVSYNNIISFKKNKASIYVEDCIKLIPENFNNTELHEYVIMPNHLHLLLEIKDKSNKSNISSIVRNFKIKITQWFYQNTDLKEIWKRSYHDHIVRNMNDYERIKKYIIDNPKNWNNDIYFN